MALLDSDDYDFEFEDAVEQRTYSNPDCVQFVSDMEAAGLTVEHYSGRFYWEGPAVRVDELQDAMSETKVRVQYDNMGLGWIVYPKASDAGVPA